MSQTIYNEKIILLVKKIKKEHFWRIGLWIAGIVLTIIWLTFLIACAIQSGRIYIYGPSYVVNDLQEIKDKWNNNTNYHILYENGNLYAKYIKDYVDWNPLCLTYKPFLVGWYLVIVLSPTGWLTFIIWVAYHKNLVTPQQVKKVVRGALAFGYLRQREVDLVCDEVDYNIGIKVRPIINEEKKEVKEMEINNEKTQKPTNQQEEKTNLFR